MHRAHTTPKIFLSDEYLRRMTYQNPFMQQLIDDNYACVEDMQWFKYETMHRYIKPEWNRRRNASSVCSPVPLSWMRPPQSRQLSQYMEQKE